MHDWVGYVWVGYAWVGYAWVGYAWARYAWVGRTPKRVTVARVRGKRLRACADGLCIGWWGATVTFGLLVTVAIVQPSIEHLRTAAAQARASLRYEGALDWYAHAEGSVYELAAQA